MPEVPPVLLFLQERAPLSEEEAYGNLNMGAGFALYLSPGDVDRACTIIRDALRSGRCRGPWTTGARGHRG